MVISHDEVELKKWFLNKPKKKSLKFKIWTNYAIHLRLHSFDKPFKCAKCGKTWQNSNELAQHYKIHTT